VAEAPGELVDLDDCLAGFMVGPVPVAIEEAHGDGEVGIQEPLLNAQGIDWVDELEADEDCVLGGAFPHKDLVEVVVKSLSLCLGQMSHSLVHIPAHHLVSNGLAGLPHEPKRRPLILIRFLHEVHCCGGRLLVLPGPDVFQLEPLGHHIHSDRRQHQQLLYVLRVPTSIVPDHVAPEGVPSQDKPS